MTSLPSKILTREQFFERKAIRQKIALNQKYNVLKQKCFDLLEHETEKFLSGMSIEPILAEVSVYSTDYDETTVTQVVDWFNNEKTYTCSAEERNMTYWDGDSKEVSSPARYKKWFITLKLNI